MTDKDPAGASQQPEQPTGAPASASTPPTWFVEFKSDVDRRFDGLATKNKERYESLDARLPKPEAAPAATPAAEGGLTAEDVETIVAFGEVRGQLGEEARKDLDALREAHGYSTAVHAARTLLKHAPPPKGGGAGAKPTIKGHGAQPASNSPDFPSSIAELMRIKAKDADRYRAIVDHADFDLNELRRQR